MYSLEFSSQYDSIPNLSDVIKFWINSTEYDPEPTWRNFFGILKDDFT